MSRFFSSKFDKLSPYTPGEQPQNMKYVKLNTNESPFNPSPKALALAQDATKNLQLYSDPMCGKLMDAIEKVYDVSRDEVMFVNGSDEALNFCVMAYCDNMTGAAAADISYGFYPVIMSLNNIDYKTIPLKEDFTIDINDYKNLGRTIFIANPNAPTGIALEPEEIEEVVKSNSDNIVVVDEAYVDFGAKSCLPLIKKYDNVIVVQTFSKSRSLAGGRLGFVAANPKIIQDLNTIRYSTNPYNINSVTMAAGVGALEDVEYFKSNCKIIAENREYLTKELKALGFDVLPSKANFVFAQSNAVSGLELYQKLKERGVLVRHFESGRIKNFNRITVGSRQQLDVLLAKIREILEEKK